MSIEHDIAAAQNQRDALIVLGRALDRIELRLSEAQPNPPADPWDEWSQPQVVPVDINGVKPEPTPAWNLHAERVAAIKAKLDAATDSEDIDALQAALRLARDAAGEKAYEARGAALPAAVPDGKRTVVESDGSNGTVVLPPTSHSRHRARREWAEANQLHDYIGLDAATAIVAFAKGGPMWLIHGNRTAVMQMPFAARQWLVEEIARDSEAEAQEVGRDLLKSSSSTDKDITVAAIETISAARGA